MVKKAFTINQFRTAEEINSYKELLVNNIYQAIEIFYPYDRDDEAKMVYTNSIKSLLEYNPEVVLHLPFGKNNNLLINEDGIIISRIKDSIDYGKSLKAKKFTLHLGYATNNRSEDIMRIIEILKELTLYDKDIFIMIENMPSNNELGYSPKEIRYIIDAVGMDNLKFILDTGHANVSQFTISDYLTLLKNDLYHVHLNDNKGFKDEHARIGSGNIDFKTFFKENINYKELYCSEIIYKDKEDLLQYALDIDNCLNS
ncbi:MAG: sugar phosphate isomerase/epimerase family protein [Bacilli bacterium]